jgi:predicted dinucleotide-binding enzyme
MAASRYAIPKERALSEQSMPPTSIGVLGSGQVGQTLARGFADRGHDVMIGSRDPSKEELAEWLAGEGSGIRSGDLAETAQHGELLVLAVMGVAVEEAIHAAGAASFGGKVVIDATNPLDFSAGFPPTLAWGHTDSGGEHVQRAIPDANVVKAFNIIGSPYFVEPRFSEGKPTMFIAGNDADAKETVGRVLADFGWPPAVDIGGIEGSRELEELCILWVRLGGARGAWDHGFKLLAG